jgi:fructose-1,6-bisphosphatase/sedoheptulose 1,7-bisphosphatase-like protein
MIKTLEDELNELKDEVIKYKNMIIFGYMTTEDTIDVFDKIKENINELSTFLEYNINSFNNIVNNKERNAIIIELKENIYNNYIIYIIICRLDGCCF